MKKLLMKLGIALVGVSCLVATPGLSAQCCPDPCCDPCCDPCWNDCFDWCDGEFMVGAHALYWRPYQCQIIFATRSVGPTNNVTNRTNHQLTADYDWGVRGFAGYNQDCTFVGISYLWLETDDTSTIRSAANDLLPIAIVGAQAASGARGHLRFQYQNVDVRVGQQLHKGCGCSFGVFVNGRWVQLDRKFDVKYFADETAASSYREKDELNGGAIGIGVMGEFCIWNGVNAFGEINPMAVIAERKNQTETTVVQSTGLRINDIFPTLTSVMPALDLRFGLNYTWDCMCTTLVFELGYELNYYWTSLNQPATLGATAAAAPGFRACDDQGFGGIFFGGRVMF